jgi:hypothetical protein
MPRPPLLMAVAAMLEDEREYMGCEGYRTGRGGRHSLGHSGRYKSIAIGGDRGSTAHSGRGGRHSLGLKSIAIG